MGWLALPAIAVAFVAVPGLTGVPRRVVDGCAEWIGLAGGLELLSVVGFVVAFKLVFGARVRWRDNVPAGLRAVGATILLPAGGLVGPALGARSGSCERTCGELIARPTVAFVLITAIPGLIVLGVVGLLLSLGWLPGPHDPARTLAAAGAAVTLLAGLWLIPRPSPIERRHRGPVRRIARGLRVVREGAEQARALVRSRNWKLLGAFGYYAFDNAVLWAAFRAYGPAPRLTVIVMGYLVGSLGSALPVPAGVGAVEGGLIGALVLYGAPVLPATGAVLLYRGISLLLPVGISGCAWALVPAAKLRVGIAQSRERSRSAQPAIKNVLAERVPVGLVEPLRPVVAAHDADLHGVEAVVAGDSLRRAQQRSTHPGRTAIAGHD